MRKYDRVTNLDYRVWLECGCPVLMRVQPVRPRTRFACSQGLGHGYLLRWARWEGINAKEGCAGSNPDAG